MAKLLSRRSTFLILLLSLVSTIAAGQEKAGDEAAPRRTISEDGAIEIHQPGGAVKRIPLPTGKESLDTGELFLDELARRDPSVRAKQAEAAREYYEYRIQGYRHRRGVFQWQHFSTRVIFLVVVLLVFAGIYFAAVQFHVGLGRKGRAREAAAVTEIDASLKGIKVSSPVLGVIILTLSLAFFYLYLVYVYPISEIF